MSEGNKKFLYVNRKAPYGTVYALESLEVVLIGAALKAWHSNDVRWEACDDARELSRHLIGAFLMGTGGLLSLGCTVGQGLSAISVLALSAPIVLASIFIGAWLGLMYLVEGSAAGAIRQLFGHRAED